VDGIFGFILAGFALAGSPGPNTLSLAAAGAAFGMRRSLRYMAGATIGVVAVMVITATGLIGVLLAVPGAMPVIAALAIAYFVYLAWRIATAPPLSDTAELRVEPSLAAGVFQSLVNPKAYAAMAALFSGFVLVHDAVALDAGAKLAVVTVIIVIVNVGWLRAGAALTRFFRDARTSRIVNVTFAALLLISVAVAFLL
jgi:threonine/homoserine/homoserine lactone efflux protein